MKPLFTSNKHNTKALMHLPDEMRLACASHVCPTSGTIARVGIGRPGLTISLYIYIYMYMCMYIYIYIYTHTCIHIHIYVYTHIYYHYYYYVIA